MPKIADVPWIKEQIVDLAGRLPTPFHFYHEEGIRNTVRGLSAAFSGCLGSRTPRRGEWR
eukprot:CAMPEP_0176292406 /NCGR_PEP_ID=MMETSP0121_2-20121125/56065_1 /TAXON_ID=160619 /ORGANISM="Kryptoperidinium foliaceum, Strain CCMP 1326" /LENGTH=59 /DNA_ID=CAMNT_0017633313 /DNA_START=61 /DNA_END=237 /DNA_ORIENTATION=+